MKILFHERPFCPFSPNECVGLLDVPNRSAHAQVVKSVQCASRPTCKLMIRNTTILHTYGHKQMVTEPGKHLLHACHSASNRPGHSTLNNTSCTQIHARVREKCFIATNDQTPHSLHEQRTTNNGQRTTDNDKKQQTTNNGQRHETANDERRTTNDERRTTNDEPRTTNERTTDSE